MKKNELLGFFLLFVFLGLVFYVSIASDKASMTLDQKTYTLLFGEIAAFAGIILLLKEHRKKNMAK